MSDGSHGGRRDSVMPNTSQQASTTAVKVVVRIRPTTRADASSTPSRFQRTVVQPLGPTSLQANNPPPSAGSAHVHTAANVTGAGGAKQAAQTFTYDRVIGPDEGQADVYEAAQPLVDSFLEGFNTTIFAYGQTAAGKSWTMGTDLDGTSSDDLDRQGITPRAVAEIFERLATTQRTSRGGFSFDVKVSYLEMYNEDLIDLLAGDVDVRPTVLIREDKSGQILLQGIREVKASSASQVMDLLAQGSALRQTGATDMNAQSSRSHAIFSLTVTRRKWIASGPPPSAPATPSSPQNRRMSGLPRISSPVPPGRAGTPTGDRPGSRFGLRPPSSLGRPSTPGAPSSEDGDGSWTISTSKLHFVDLAGSERLKRTAAAGDRAKEGISINAGLSALGNVISALGDPTKKAMHIPYRNSKLTRLLQDSLGGNARTMMIACVSPVELNLAETLNTLRYANRARNIKNRAELNEVEQGWDDIEYLQRTIVKLRGELHAINGRDSAALNLRSIDLSSAPDEAELQQKIAQLTTELAIAQAAASGSPTTPTAPLSRDQFAAAIEPIVEEYERSLSALESQLALARAALGHSDEEMRDLEARIAEEQQANGTTTALIDELRTRIVKLSEREEKTEAYVRDLEARLRDVDDAEESHGAAVGNLRKELARHREQAAANEAHVQELESRLVSAEEGNATLRHQVEVLERGVARREELCRDLEARVQHFDSSSDNKQLLAEIDNRDRRLRDLEKQLDALQARADDAADKAVLLQKVALEEKTLKEELESRVRTLENGQAHNLAATPPRLPALRFVHEGSLHLPDSSTAEVGEIGMSPSAQDALAELEALRAQIAQLQLAHEETTGELGVSKSKYAESLREIADLNAQVQEAHLLHTQASVSDLSDAGELPGTSAISSRTTRDRDEDNKENVEVDQLSARAIQGVGRNGLLDAQRAAGPRAPHARQSMSMSPQHRLSFFSRDQGAVSPARLRSHSLSQELSLAASFQISCPKNLRPVSPSPGSRSRRKSSSGPLSTMTANIGGERSYEQLRSDVLKLQAALDAREAEISESAATVESMSAEIQQLRLELKGGPAKSPLYADMGHPREEVRLRAEELATTRKAHEQELRQVKAALVDGAAEYQRSLESTMAQHSEAIETLQAEHAAAVERAVQDREEAIRSSIAESERTAVERAELNHSADMAARATAHDNQVAALRAAHDAELEARSISAAETRERTRAELVQAHGEELDALRRSLAASAAEDVDRLRSQNESALAKITESHSTELDRLRFEHTSRLEERSAAHADELATLRRSQETALEERSSSAAEGLEQLRVELATAHVAELETLRNSHEQDLKARSGVIAEQVGRARLEIVKEHDAAVAALKSEHLAAIQRVVVEKEAAADEHGKEILASRASAHEEGKKLMAALTGEYEESLSEAKQADAAALATARQSHATSIDGLRARLAAEHAAVVEKIRQDHTETLEALRAEHAAAIGKNSARAREAAAMVEAEHDSLKSEHRVLASSLSAAREELVSAKESLSMLTTERDELAQRLNTLAVQHANSVADSAKAVDTLGLSLTDQQKAHPSLSASPTGAGHDVTAALSALQEARDESTQTEAVVDARTAVARLESQLNATRKERDALSTKLARMSLSSASAASRSLGSRPQSQSTGHFAPSSDATAVLSNRATTPTGDLGRAMSPPLRIERFLSDGSMVSLGAPLPTSPPSIPPSPAPLPTAPLPALPQDSPSRMLGRRSSNSSVAESSVPRHGSLGPEESGSSAQLNPEAVRAMREQLEATVMRVKQQLAQRDADYHSQVDLINTLERALSDSERNLRKARLQSNEYGRERDSLKEEADRLRREAQESHSTCEGYRQSVLEMEERLQEQHIRELRAERARQEFAERMDEVGKRKSRFACF